MIPSPYYRPFPNSGGYNSYSAPPYYRAVQTWPQEGKPNPYRAAPLPSIAIASNATTPSYLPGPAHNPQMLLISGAAATGMLLASVALHRKLTTGSIFGTLKHNLKSVTHSTHPQTITASQPTASTASQPVQPSGSVRESVTLPKKASTERALTPENLTTAQPLQADKTTLLQKGDALADAEIPNNTITSKPLAQTGPGIARRTLRYLALTAVLVGTASHAGPLIQSASHILPVNLAQGIGHAANWIFQRFSGQAASKAATAISTDLIVHPAYQMTTDLIVPTVTSGMGALGWPSIGKTMLTGAAASSLAKTTDKNLIQQGFHQAKNTITSLSSLICQANNTELVKEATQKALLETCPIDSTATAAKSFEQAAGSYQWKDGIMLPLQALANTGQVVYQGLKTIAGFPGKILGVEPDTSYLAGIRGALVFGILGRQFLKAKSIRMVNGNIHLTY